MIDDDKFQTIVDNIKKSKLKVASLLITQNGDYYYNLTMLQLAKKNIYI